MKYGIKNRGAVATIKPEQCHHFWLIEEPSGPTSTGVCKICGAHKEFLNTIPAVGLVKKQASAFNLPKMPDVSLDEESRQ